MSVKGLTALVTGGGSGIGLASAKLLLSEGANVVISGRSAQRLRSAQNQLSAYGEAQCVTADITDAAGVEAMVDKTRQAFGSLDIVVNCAGIFIGGSLCSLGPNDFAAAIDTNLKGSWLVCRYATPHLMEKGGCIIFISSYLGIRAQPQTPCSPYAAAKAGVLGMTRALAVELAPYRIRVNAVVPSLIDTPMTSQRIEESGDPQLLDRYKRAHPAGRIGKPQDVAQAIAFLADPTNDWLTGVELAVDGGRSVT